MHLFCNGQGVVDLQLQVTLFKLLLFLLFLMILLLCLLMILCMLSMQLYPSFTVFLLKILCSLLFTGKCFSIRLINILPTFVLTCALYGGVNHINFLSLFLFLLLLLLCFSMYYSLHSLYPLLSSALS